MKVCFGLFEVSEKNSRNIKHNQSRLETEIVCKTETQPFKIKFVLKSDVKLVATLMIDGRQIELRYVLMRF